MKPLNLTVSQFKESIFSTMTKLAIDHQAINLSQGFPDFDGPKWLIDLASQALNMGHLGKNQYAPSPGILPLREAIANNYKRFYGLDFDLIERRPESGDRLSICDTSTDRSSIQAMVHGGVDWR